MKKVAIMLLVFVVVISMLFLGTSCKATPAATTTAAATEATTVTAASAETTVATTAAYNIKAQSGTEITVAMDDRIENNRMIKLLPQFEEATGIKVNIEQMYNKMRAF